MVQCLSCQLHWPMTPLLFRGVSPLLGLERTWDVRRRFTDRRLTATAGFWSQTSSHWLWSWTLNGSVRCGDRLETKLCTDSTLVASEQKHLFSVRQSETRQNRMNLWSNILLTDLVTTLLFSVPLNKLTFTFQKATWASYRRHHKYCPVVGRRLSYVTCGQRPSFLWPAHHFDGHDLGWWLCKDMAMPVAPGTPAVFVFLNEAVMDHVRDGLDWCYGSIFPCQRVYCCDLECQEAVNLCTSLIHPLQLQYSIFFFFWQLSIIYL